MKVVVVRDIEALKLCGGECRIEIREMPRDILISWLRIYLTNGAEICVAKRPSCLAELAGELGVKPVGRCDASNADMVFISDCNKYYIVLRGR
ncbi:MAG: hypothetical protein ACP5MH_10290 [Thermoproteus sp.]